MTMLSLEPLNNEVLRSVDGKDKLNRLMRDGIQWSTEWMFGPGEAYERRGDVDDVVFPCGHTIASDGDTIRMYYGVADSSIALAIGSVRTMLE